MGILLKILLVGVLACVEIDAHGYMMTPAARNSAWRFGFGTPINDNDSEVFCGSRPVQLRNGGRCGVCGDAWDAPQPRPHERGGQFGSGVITASYREGQIIPVTIAITANHNGYYEFRLCNNSDPLASDSQECLDQNLLQLADGSGSRYNLTCNTSRFRHKVYVQLPAELTCSHCILQWKWVAANIMGRCPNGQRRTGCGPQQHFVNCADVRILSKGQPDDFETPMWTAYYSPELANVPREKLPVPRRGCNSN